MKTWENSQKYELDHAIKFMKTEYFVKLVAQHRSGLLKSSKNYINKLLLKEFFCDNMDEWKKFLDHISGKYVLEIGPCCYSIFADIDEPKEKIIIEPLAAQIDQWQKNNFGFSTFDNLNCHSVAGEVFLEKYSKKIDGAIYCRNMLDHTPHWPFVLANISSYAKKGCILLLWTDIDHGKYADEGHYNITPDHESFQRLIEELGFKILRTYNDKDRKKTNYGCYAIKV